MKSQEEILKRIICLLCFTDRAYLESPVIEGIRRSLKEREDQRQIINDWLKRNHYYENLTDKEKRIMETPVTGTMNNDIARYSYDYECIRPLMWSVGLVDTLSGYDDYGTGNLHLPIRIEPVHTVEKLKEFCKEIPIEMVERQREMAMLWYWRCIERRISGMKNINYLDAVKETFGMKHMLLLRGNKGFDRTKGDFTVRGRTVASLSKLEAANVELYSERRYYAFEWLLSDDAWDEIDLVC